MYDNINIKVGARWKIAKGADVHSKVGSIPILPLSYIV